MKNNPTIAPAKRQGITVPTAEITIASIFLAITSSLLSRRSDHDQEFLIRLTKFKLIVNSILHTKSHYISVLQHSVLTGQSMLSGLISLMNELIESTGDKGSSHRWISRTGRLHLLPYPGCRRVRIPLRSMESIDSRCLNCRSLRRPAGVASTQAAEIIVAVDSDDGVVFRRANHLQSLDPFQPQPFLSP